MKLQVSDALLQQLGGRLIPIQPEPVVVENEETTDEVIKQQFVRAALRCKVVTSQGRQLLLDVVEKAYVLRRWFKTRNPDNTDTD